jgi:hypothetical protein
VGAIEGLLDLLDLFDLCSDSVNRLRSNPTIDATVIIADEKTLSVNRFDLLRRLAFSTQLRSILTGGIG